MLLKAGNFELGGVGAEIGAIHLGDAVGLGRARQQHQCEKKIPHDPVLRQIFKLRRNTKEV